MKDKWETGQIEWEDIVRFIVLIDESHEWVNTSKPEVLDILNHYLREAPKFFGSIVFASHSIRDFFPSMDGVGAGAADVTVINKLKNLFELTQYKIIFHQESSALPMLDISERGKDNEKEEAQEEVSKQNMEDLNRVINNAINSENQTSITDDSQENNISKESLSEEISATSELQINGLNEEVIQYTGNNQERMKNEIRTWLNSYGFAEETAVTFYGECLIDYNTENVTISFTLDSNQNIGIDYIYNRKNDSVSVVTW